MPISSSPGRLMPESRRAAYEASLVRRYALCVALQRGVFPLDHTSHGSRQRAIEHYTEEPPSGEALAPGPAKRLCGLQPPLLPGSGIGAHTIRVRVPPEPCEPE